MLEVKVIETGLAKLCGDLCPKERKKRTVGLAVSVEVLVTKCLDSVLD